MIVLIGATGTVGRHVAHELTARGMPFRALVRDPARARALLGSRAALVQGDLDRPASLAPALKGCERMLLASPVDPRQRELQGNAIAAARDAGVGHVVKLSNLGADPASDFPIARWHGEIERALKASGMAWTHLRPHAFMQNLLHQTGAIKAGGEIAGPYGAGRISMIDARDIAAVALAALTAPGHEGRAYELTGPEAVSWGQVAEKLSRVLGRSVRYADISTEEARRRMIAGGRPDWYTDALIVLFLKWARGGYDLVSDAVERVTGSPTRGLERFLADHARALREA